MSPHSAAGSETGQAGRGAAAPWRQSPWYDPEENRKHGPHGGSATIGARGLLIKKGFNLSFELADTLAAEAEATGRTQSEIVREVLRERYEIE